MGDTDGGDSGSGGGSPKGRGPKGSDTGRSGRGSSPKGRGPADAAAGVSASSAASGEGGLDAIANLLALNQTTPPPPAVPATDPAAEARLRAIEAEKIKRGRRATIFTSGRGLDDDQLGIITRPVARSARLLGG